MKNVKRKDNFTQVCIWPGTLMNEEQIPEFEEWFKEEFGTRVQYLESIETAPDRDENGYQVEGTGGRHDVFFAVHSEDGGKFAIPRLGMGIRWVEDAVSSINGGNRLYPARVNYYCSW